MIAIDRLFHIDLTHRWNRALGAYEPLAPAAFEALFAEPMRMLDQDLVAFIAPRCLFPQDPEYVEQVASLHHGARLVVEIVSNVETQADDGEPTFSQTRRALPLDGAALDEIRAMLPRRLSFEIPALAEVAIVLDNPAP